MPGLKLALIKFGFQYKTNKIIYECDCCEGRINNALFI